MTIHHDAARTQARDALGRFARGEASTAIEAELGAWEDEPAPPDQLALSDQVSQGDLLRMLDPASPVTSRLAATRTEYRGVAAIASRDPDPLVRAVALETGWDLSEEDRERLLHDAEVARAVDKLRRFRLPEVV